MDLKDHITSIPDFPKPGILFYDVSTLLRHADAWQVAMGRMARSVRQWQPDLLAGVESRGFLLAAPLALKLGCGFVMLRKRGKLPGKVVGHDYALEYGTDRLEIQADAVQPGQRVVIVDDLLATGGTMAAGITLLQGVGATVAGAAALIELTFLGGRQKLGVPFETLVSYDRGADRAGREEVLVTQGITRRLALGSVLAMAAGAAGPVGPPFPDGATLLVAGPEGGAVDSWAGWLAPSLGRALPPGTALRKDVVGGTDGVTGANQFEARIAPDGGTALLLPGSAAMAWLVGDPRARFDVSQWIPALAGVTPGLLVSRVPLPRVLGGTPIRVQHRDLPARNCRLCWRWTCWARRGPRCSA